MGDMINLDGTILYQLANFIITIIVLNYLLIKPVREQIAARSALLGGYATEAEQFAAKASEKLSSYEGALSAARTEATSVREALKAEGKDREQNLLAAAQADAQNFVQQERTRTAAEAKAALNALLAQVNVFADKAVSRILG
jgi:F-type H+-transporting ATPase subunit b